MVRSFRYAIMATTAIAIPIANGDRDVPLWWYTRNHSGVRDPWRYLGRWVKESSKGGEDRKLRSLLVLVCLRLIREEEAFPCNTSGVR
ncbi:hypothetical protein PRIC2_006511 [Phytophthora ramorum]